MVSITKLDHICVRSEDLHKFNWSRRSHVWFPLSAEQAGCVPAGRLCGLGCLFFSLAASFSYRVTSLPSWRMLRAEEQHPSG